MPLRGLKPNIAINIAVILLVGMLLIEFVTIITAQRDMIRFEISRGNLLISSFKQSLVNFSAQNNPTHHFNLKNRFDRMMDEAGFTCALIMDGHKKQVYFGVSGCNLKDELIELTHQAVVTGEKTTRFFGTVWGVFWMQNKDVVLSSPVKHNGRIIGAISIALPLDRIYETLRRSQKILFIYIFVNTAILTFIGLYRLSKVYLEPMYRLVKRADEYREDDEIFFAVRKEDNELNQLSKALNRMLERISADREKLRAMVISLEKANFDLKQAQQKIIRAEKLASVGRLSSGIAHEIGNPIGIIIGYLELLKQKDITDNERTEYIIRTENEVNRINTIIRQLLDLSRPSDAGSKVVSVHEVINDISNVIEPQPMMANIKLELELEAQMDTVFADPNQLRQVFLNLILNAADAISFSTKKITGKLVIKSAVIPGSDSDGNPMLQLIYMDNGPGISPENLENIFDPFYTTKEPGKGTGLGLSVSFMIIENFGGKIEATSIEGEGTTITVLLPLHVEK
ncbi:MAG: ATP-binding protein [Thermodesulfobacteriota bacterium]|nr:ATP-binding protein [Thermodesulfobacteriota bacterium]